MHKFDILAIITQFAGLTTLASDVTFQSSLSTLFGSASPKILAVIGLLAVLASTVLRIAGSPSSTPSSQGVTK
jgi:hypothetical protein